MDAVQRFTARSKIKARLEDEDQKKERKEKKKKISNGKFIFRRFYFFLCVWLGVCILLGFSRVNTFTYHVTTT